MTESNAGQAKLSRQLQEEIYRFPYHHVVSFDARTYRGFRQCKNSPGGYRYASYVIRVLEELEKEQFSSLIDVGCGDGFLVGMMFERFPGVEIAGVDLSEQAILFAQAFNVGRNVQFLCQDIVADRIDSRYDVATLIEVLEHIPPADVGSFLEAIHAMLNRGGKLIVTVPSVNLSIAQIKRHFQHFDEESLAATLSPHFRVLKIEYLNRDGLVAKILDRVFTNRLFILNSEWLVEALFAHYLNRFLTADRSNGLRLLAVCQQRERTV